MDTTQLIDTNIAPVTISAATLATTPPALVSMVELPAPKLGTASLLQVELLGDAGERLLSAAYWWGWSALTDKPTLIGPVLGGVDVTLSSARGAGELLVGVAGIYTHLGITGTLAGDSLVMHAALVETRGD